MQRKAACFICGNTDHRARGCKLATTVKNLIKSVRQNHLGKAFAVESDSEQGEELMAEDDGNEELDPEVTRINREVGRTISRTVWIANTGATSHMTNKTELFRRPLQRMNPRIIKCGGGFLQSDRYGDVEIHHTVQATSDRHGPGRSLEEITGPEEVRSIDSRQGMAQNIDWYA